jgi:predicted nucleic acid-binding protein
MVSDGELAAAWAAYDRGDAAGAGIVDCISFAVMRRFGLTDVFTNDQHFAAAGFTPLF